MPNILTSERFAWLDALRGIAVVLMVIFHFCYDLSYFGWLEADVSGPSAWMPFRYLIVTTFVLTMGCSLYLAYHRAMRWKHFAHRQLKLLGFALLISLSSTLMYPNAWVYFGILHFMLAAGFICLPFIRFWWAALPCAAIIFAISWIQILPFNWPFNYIDSWLPSARTIDFVPPIPWLAPALLGVCLGHLVVNTRFSGLQTINPAYWLVFLGRKSLIIYLLHQPVLFLLLYPLSFVI